MDKPKLRKHHCPKCGYDLRKNKIFIDAWHRCPQCGLFIEPDF